jgi:uncharacterized membrane protein (UPF0136 family)
VPDIARISLLVFSILVCAGGVVGFLKAKSKASLIAGLVSAALLALSYSISGRNVKQGLIMGAVVSALLCIMMGIRFGKTKKFMPAGMIAVLSLIETILIGVAIADV